MLERIFSYVRNVASKYLTPQASRCLKRYLTFVSWPFDYSDSSEIVVVCTKALSWDVLAVFRKMPDEHRIA